MDKGQDGEFRHRSYNEQIRAVRGFTKRDAIIKFEGCYHGYADGLQGKAGSGASDLWHS